MKFEHKFKELRKTTGYKQTEFGEMLGLSQQSVSQLESGKKKPSKTLLAYLNYRYSGFFDGENGGGCFVAKDRPAIVNTFRNPKIGETLIKHLSAIDFLNSQIFELIVEQIEVAYNKVVVKDEEGNPYQIGDSVEVIKPEHNLFGNVCRIFTIRNYDNNPKMNVEVIGKEYMAGLVKPDDIKRV